MGSGSYRMPLPLPVGEYRIAAWAGVSDDFEMPELVAGKSTLEDLMVRMKRKESLVHNKALNPLWYGEVTDCRLYRQTGTDGNGLSDKGYQ